MKNIIIASLAFAVAGWAIHDLTEPTPPIPKHCPHLMTQYDLQQRLKELGYDVGIADGVVGPRTLRAWRKYEEDSYFDRILENK